MEHQLAITEFDDRDQLARALADALTRGLGEALARGETPLLRVSGGSTPLPLFRALASAPLRWRNVWIGLVDDRWVGPQHEASNDTFVQRELMSEDSAAAKARWVGLVDVAQGVETAPKRWAEMVGAGVPAAADQLVLGMGGDGHFASLFPGMPGLDAALDLEAAPGTLSALAPAEPKQRISLNLSAIAASRLLYLHITGESKRRLLDKALAGDPCVAHLPISALIRELGSRLQVYWAP